MSQEDATGTTLLERFLYQFHTLKSHTAFHVPLTDREELNALKKQVAEVGIETTFYHPTFTG
jgi:hypothetical protein